MGTATKSEMKADNEQDIRLNVMEYRISGLARANTIGFSNRLSFQFVPFSMYPASAINIRSMSST
jgi:hypothetical protein